MLAILLLIAIFATANIEADEISCKKKLDLTLAVDSSSTICDGSTTPCPKWYAILDFAKDLINALIIGEHGSKVAFVTLGNRTKVEWNLNRYDDKQSLLTAIDNVKYTGGELIDIVSVSKIITGIYNPLVGDRANATNVGILISDGAPRYPDIVYATESFTIQTVSNAIVFGVCVTSRCSEHCARGVASPPKKVNETYFLVNDYLSIGQVGNKLAKKVCAAEFNLAKTVTAYGIYALQSL